MKRITVICFLFLCFSYIYAEKTEDKYIVRPVQDGLLYFIEPFEVPSKQKMQAAELDITHIAGSDSLTLNMSVWLPEMVDADSIGFGSTENIIIRDFKTFYIDKDKSKFKHRYSCTLPYRYLHTMYQQRQPYTMTVYAGTCRLQYGFAEKAWGKECEWMRQILVLIDRNSPAHPLPASVGGTNL